MKGIMCGVLLVMLASCGSRSIVTPEPMYFDLKGYVAMEIPRLSKEVECVTKSVQIDTATESKLTSRPDTTFWKRELVLLAAADINLAAYRGAYEVERELLLRGDSLITFTATTSKPETRLLQITRSRDRVMRVEVEQSNENIVYSTIRHLTYVPDSLYRVESVQRTRGVKERKLVIEYRFECE